MTAEPMIATPSEMLVTPVPGSAEPAASGGLHRPAALRVAGESSLVPAGSAVGSGAMLDVTVIVPTFNESANVAELVRRLCALDIPNLTEILFVDDSTDDTPSVIEQVARNSAIQVRLLHRPMGERIGGLAGAVTSGLAAARGPIAVVMDGDLQHPPEAVPELLKSMSALQSNLVVASRYCGAGDARGLDGGWRRQASKGSTTAARALFPRRVGRRCTDPMTGFFAVDRRFIELTRLQATGFKILLEILVSHDLVTSEIPFNFAERFSGESKASWRRGVEFLWQLLRLRFSSSVVRFAAVGMVGALLNLAIMALLLGDGVRYLPAAVIASEITIVTNFLLQERFVFHDHSNQRRFWVRAAHSLALNNAELLLRIPLLAVLVSFLHLPELLAAGVALVVAFVGRYLFLSRVTYRRAKSADSASSQHMTTFEDNTARREQVAR